MLTLFNFPTKKIWGPYGFNGEFFQIVKEQIIPNLYKLLQRIEKGMRPSSVFNTSKHWYQNQKKKLQKAVTG